MRRTSYEQMNCSIASALDVVGEPWTLLIVRDAFYGVRRFDDFQENLGIARNVLTARLKKLVEAGIFRKTAYRQRPLRHEYRLTDKGQRRELTNVRAIAGPGADQGTRAFFERLAINRPPATNR
jgi:DNA-binding HxlR family transcriptional regulator